MDTGQKKEQTKKLFKQHTELEILVSAAIVFAAVNSREVVLNLTYELLNSNIADYSFFIANVILTGLITATIFPISIITHLLLRSYWLALVGLRLAFEDNEGKPLGFSEPYQSKIDKYLDLDLQIKKMDQITSSVFSFSFLILFCFLFSLTFFLVVVYGLNGLSSLLEGIPGTDTLLSILLFLLLICGSFYLFDFFSLGRLKRIEKKWFHKIYFPIYQVFSLITFAWLYRGIYYTLISRVSKKLVFIVLPLYVIITLIAINLGYNSYLLYPDGSELELRKTMYSRVMYMDEVTRRTPILHPMIQSRTITDESHIRLFIPLTLNLEDSLISRCNGIRPFMDRGLHWEKHFKVRQSIEIESSVDDLQNAKAILRCLKEQVTIVVNDSIISPRQFRFATIPVPERSGVETYFSIKWMETGNHLIKVSSPTLMTDEVEIPFWKD